MKYLEYKGYTGTIEYSKEDKLLFGKVVGIKGLLSYEGSTGIKLERDFKSVIDEYLKDCRDLGNEPEKPYKGSFNVRIPSELHRDAALKAIELNTSLNSFVSESIRSYLNTIPLSAFLEPVVYAEQSKEKRVTMIKARKFVKK